MTYNIIVYCRTSLLHLIKPDCWRKKYKPFFLQSLCKIDISIIYYLGYIPNSDFSGCIACPAGQYCPSGRQDSVKSCPDGTYSLEAQQV